MTFTSTDDVAHPHFKDTVVQKTLAHKASKKCQQDEVKLGRLIKHATKAQRNSGRMFTTRTEGSKKNRREICILEGILYAGQENQGPAKPALRQSMKAGEIFRSHKRTKH